MENFYFKFWTNFLIFFHSYIDLVYRSYVYHFLYYDQYRSYIEYIYTGNFPIGSTQIACLRMANIDSRHWEIEFNGGLFFLRICFTREVQDHLRLRLRLEL
jgi:hypothetical protein